MFDSSDDEGPSDISMIHAAQATREFKEKFPLKSETLKKQELERARRTPAVRKKLNFDVTMSPSFVEAEIKTVQANSEILERKLTMKNEEIERLKTFIQKKEEENNRLNFQKTQAEEELRREKYQNNAKIARTNLELEKWQTIGKKFYTWFNIAKSQLEEVQELNGDDWENPEKIEKINQISREFYKFLENNQFTEDFVDQLAAGSIQSYCGVEFPVRQNMKTECVRGSEQLNSTELKPPGNERYNYFDRGGRYNRTSIDYEKDEKIQRLLLENSVLKDNLKIVKGRSERSMIIEERNRSLEVEKDSLQNRLDQTFGEIEAMRMGQARQIFNIDNCPENSEKYLRLIDRINGLLIENKRLEKDFEAATSRITKMDQDLKNAERRNSHLEDVYSNQVSKFNTLQKEMEDVQAKYDTSLENFEEVAAKLKEAEKKIEESSVISTKSDGDSTLLAAPPTDAGNSTQIFHMASNPLNLAHAEFQDQETKKRKLSELDGAEDSEAKRIRQEKIDELEEQLQMLEREKNVIEDSYKLHKDLANKFRQICIALTGLQIKLKDAEEGICTVQSEYEETNQGQFVFKCFYGTTRIDMLDVNSDSSAEMIRKWEPLMKKYIGERNSIPAFLAAMTLQLEQEREFDETMHERTHTFSVYHED
ncbi:unnamed protein product [Caenorhabditis angaria]|uniref:Uncharacterized protein n=1 Tax=Caenorhabditis angaria TaxID=860376 RepID=A0A9P1I3J2_9PELO|nr:unnamed protein product [Caenorhabditis angaria]